MADIRGSTSTRSPQSDWHRLGRLGRALVALELLLAVCALGGGIYLMANANSAMPIEWLDGTPLHSWFWPGVALIVGIAMLPASVAIAALRDRPFARAGHLTAGLTLVGWICVQVAVIGLVSWMQPFMFAVGLLIAALGAAQLRTSRDPVEAST